MVLLKGFPSDHETEFDEIDFNYCHDDDDKRKSTEGVRFVIRAHLLTYLNRKLHERVRRRRRHDLLCKSLSCCTAPLIMHTCTPAYIHTYICMHA